MESNCKSIHDDRSGVSWHDLSKSDYAKVIFCDLYNLHHNKVGCRFQITDNVHEDPCDYIGLFRVGYDNISQCLIFKLLSETKCEEDGKQLCCEFKWNELPKLEHGFYQFVYITCDKEICGASMPFEIRGSDAQNDSSDEDIVAENVEDDYILVKSNAKEKVTLLLSLLDEYRVKNLTLSSELEKCTEEKAKLMKEHEETFANMRKKIMILQDARHVEELKAEEKLKALNEAHMKALEDSAMAKNQEKVELEAKLKEVTEELWSVNSSKKELADKCKYLEELTVMQQAFEKELEEKEVLIKKFENEIAENKVLIEKFEHELAENKVLIEKLEKKLGEKNTLVVRYDKIISEKSILVVELERKLEKKNSTIEELEEEVTVFKEDLDDKSVLINKLKREISALQNTIKNSSESQADKHENKINSLEKELDEKNILIDKLKSEISALQSSIKNSSEDHADKVYREAIQTNTESSNIISGEEPSLSLDVKSYCEENKGKSALELKCENLSLALKLSEKTTALSEEKKSYSILKNEYQILKSELEKKVISLNKVLNSLDEYKIENLRLKEELERETLTCAELKQLSNEKDYEITALKLMLDYTSKQMKSDFEKEVAGKEALIKKLSMENSQLQGMRNQSEDLSENNEASLHAALAESVSRLKEAEELYKKQFLEISKLKKKFKNKCGKKQKVTLSESCSQASESFSSVEVKEKSFSSIEATGFSPGGSLTKKVPSLKDTSDSDTGEHVLGNTVPLYPQFQNIFPEAEHVKQQLQPNVSCKPSNQKSIVNESNACPSTETTKKGVVIQQMATSSARHKAFQQCVERPSYAVEDEIFYSVPCVVCEVPIKISSTFNENMVKHLEKVHQQQMCPICGRLYSMSLPQKYFLYHVDDHFAN